MNTSKPSRLWPSPAAGSTIARAALLFAAFGYSLPLGGCEDPKAVLVARYNAAQAPASPTTGRAAAAAQLHKDWQAGKVTLDLAIDHASMLLQEGKDATAYAGAVLDLATSIEDRIPRQPEASELLLLRLGRLAFAAASRAAENGRLAEARELAFAGPKRWQTERYWLRYPDHDAFASVAMATVGEKQAALDRLRERSVDDQLLQEAREMIRKMTP